MRAWFERLGRFFSSVVVSHDNTGRWTVVLEPLETPISDRSYYQEFPITVTSRKGLPPLGLPPEGLYLISIILITFW